MTKHPQDNSNRLPCCSGQEYLDSAKRGGEVGRTAGVPYKFSFYLRDSSAELEELEGGAGGQAPFDHT